MVDYKWAVREKDSRSTLVFLLTFHYIESGVPNIH